MLELSGYLNALSLQGEEGQDRIDNVKEFASNIAQYELENDEPTLSDFLEQLALISDIDSFDNEADRVVLMTIHSAKGLEFNNVYLVGMEEGIFPGNQSIYGGNDEIEEERRLAYVAITRAKKRLVVTNASTRMLFGSTGRNMPSRFLREIPSEYCDCSVSSGGFGYRSYDGNSFDGFSRSNQYNDYTYGSEFSKFATAKPKKSFASSFTSTAAKPISASNSLYSVGQQVSHKTFGIGLILGVVPAGGDTMLEIAFDKVGTKKLMANYAKLTIL